MKNLMMTLTVAFAGISAQASMVEEYSADLTKFQFQAESVLADYGNVTGGTVDVTPISDITITLYRTPSCAPKCKIAYAPIVYQVPAKERHTGHCGEIVFSGEQDLRTVDGEYTAITVTDNTQNHCKYFAAIPQTQVKLVIKGGHDNLDETHTMSGEKMIELQ
jgi:hypothetical protein